MASLKPLDIYKLLPKKNCKECGDPTCLTFAMKLAGGKAQPDQCPYLDENAKAILGASTRPPIQKVKIGVGERSFTLGDRIKEITTDVRDYVLTRIGTDLRLKGIAIQCESGSPAEFSRAVEAVESVADLPEVLMSTDPVCMEAGLGVSGNYRPLIHAATHENYQEMCRLAKKFSCPLAIRADTLDSLADLSSKCATEGVSNLLLDLTSPSLHEVLNRTTAVRQHAVTRQTPALGYPVFLDCAQPGLGLGNGRAHNPPSRCLR